MLDLIVCPEPACDAPAEITDRLVMESTDGPIEHAKTYCIRRHIFVLATERVTASSPTLSSATASSAQPGRPSRYGRPRRP